MARAFSSDLRTRVLSASRDGMSARSAAKRFGIRASTAIAWIAKGRQGQMTPAKDGRPSGSRLDTQADFIATMIAAPKDICESAKSFFGRSSVYSRRQRAISARAFSRFGNQCVLRHASRRRALNDSMVAF